MSVPKSHYWVRRLYRSTDGHQTISPVSSCVRLVHIPAKDPSQDLWYVFHYYGVPLDDFIWGPRAEPPAEWESQSQDDGGVAPATSLSA